MEFGLRYSFTPIALGEEHQLLLDALAVLCTNYYLDAHQLLLERETKEMVTTRVSKMFQPLRRKGRIQDPACSSVVSLLALKQARIAAYIHHTDIHPRTDIRLPTDIHHHTDIFPHTDIHPPIY